jgi:MoxR-like ATPase
MFDSPEQTLSALSRVGYFTDQKTATTVYLAGQINKPIMLEGPAGAGKTELAQSVARAAGADLLRLQCYQGINEEKAIGQFDKSLQELFVLLKTKTEGTYDWDQIRPRCDEPGLFSGRTVAYGDRAGEALCPANR